MCSAQCNALGIAVEADDPPTAGGPTQHRLLLLSTVNHKLCTLTLQHQSSFRVRVEGPSLARRKLAVVSFATHGVLAR